MECGSLRCLAHHGKVPGVRSTERRATISVQPRSSALSAYSTKRAKASATQTGFSWSSMWKVWVIRSCTP